MADNVAITAGLGTNISTEEITDLNGVTVPAVHVQRLIASIRTANGVAVDVTSAAPMPTADAAAAATLASILAKLIGAPATEVTLGSVLTELGQKVEAADLATLSTGAKQDLAKGVLDNILTTVAALLADSQAKADLAEAQPVSAAALPLPSGAATETTQAATDAKVGAVTEAAPASDTASSGLNGRLQRVAQRLTSLLALLPASLGQKTKAGSLAVTLASDQDAIGVSSVPTDPFGLSADAIVAAGAAGTQSAKLRRATQGIEDLKTAIVLAAGANAIGKLAANAGVNIGTVDLATRSVATTTITQVASSAANVTLAALNASRKGLTIFNDSTSAVFVKFGATATATSFTVKIAAGGFYEMPTGLVYTGIIDAIWVTANGNAYVSES